MFVFIGGSYVYGWKTATVLCILAAIFGESIRLVPHLRVLHTEQDHYYFYTFKGIDIVTILVLLPVLVFPFKPTTTH